jgi:hypothetical protein
MAGDEKVLRRGFTSYIGLSAIYSITPVKEELPAVSSSPTRSPD